MKLYYSKGACSLAVRITLLELNLPCEYEAVNLKTKKTEHNKDYLEINPKGAVPALVLENGSVLTENVAIQIYLAETNHATTLLPDKADFNRYKVLEWLSFISTDVHKGFGHLFNHAIPNELQETLFKPLLVKKLEFLDKNLKDKNFLTMDQFTIADPYLFAVLRWLPHFKMDIKTWPSLAHYFNFLKERTSIQKALKAEHLEEK